MVTNLLIRNTRLARILDTIWIKFRYNLLIMEKSCTLKIIEFRRKWSTSKSDLDSDTWQPERTTPRVFRFPWLVRTRCIYTHTHTRCFADRLLFCRVSQRNGLYTKGVTKGESLTERRKTNCVGLPLRHNSHPVGIYLCTYICVYIHI